jgi:hypothetical protein
MPGARCTRSLVCSVLVAHECRHHGRTGKHPAFPHASGFNGLFRALPGDRAFLPPSPSGLRLCPRPVGPTKPPLDLTPASRRQDHTTSPSALAPFVRALVIAHRKPALRSRLRAQRCRVHRIPPRVRDDRDTPLEWGETGGVVELIWDNREGKYFCKWVWTGQRPESPSGKSAARRAQ